MYWETAAVAILFGCMAFFGARLGSMVCANITPFEDGPRPGKPPVKMLIVAGALLGAMMFRQGVGWSELVLLAFLVLALIAGWVSDVLCGIIPDAFTLLPLGVAVVVRALSHQWDFLFAGMALFVPFAVAAYFSGGRGMGWADVKLAALGGVVLGVYVAICSFLVASCVALLVASIRGRRRDPIAFGPYLSGAMGVALAMGMHGS